MAANVQTSVTKAIVSLGILAHATGIPIQALVMASPTQPNALAFIGQIKTLVKTLLA